MADKKGIRSLVQLQNNASTTRVLNLLSVARRHKDTPEYMQAPFFQNPRLNRAIVLKHRLRRDELDVFDHPRVTGTKVLFPVDPNDLRLGGRYAFVGQRNFVQLLEDVLGRQPDTLDLTLLDILDRLPSLDPFLMREELKRNGYQPAPCYLELTEADLQRIFAFVQNEIEPLVRMSLNGEVGLATQTSRLVSKILANTLDSEMEPFRLVLRLSEGDFAEGVFCWKGFLYYKWAYKNCADESDRVVQEILQVMPRGPMDSKQRSFIEQNRTSLAQAIIGAADAVKTTLFFYDTAYDELTKNGNPTAFRDFLLKSPKYFTELGERLGVLQQVISFWRYRFGNPHTSAIGADELIDIFLDFEANLRTHGPADERRVA